MSEAGGQGPKDAQLAVQLSVLEALARGQQRQLDAATAPWKARRDARLARRRYTRCPNDEVVERRLIQRITSRAFSACETMDIVMLWLGPGGETPADEVSDGDNSARDKRRRKWMWIRATEHDELSLIEEFNWRMLEGHPYDEDEWGEHVEGLEYPILPFGIAKRDKDVANYNAELLAYAKAKKRGLPVGGATNVGPAAFFRQDSTSHRLAKTAVKGAEPLLPLVMSENGRWSADAAALGPHVRAEIAAALAAHTAAQAPSVAWTGHFSRECRLKNPGGAGEDPSKGAGAGVGAQLSTGRPQSTTERMLAQGAGAGFVAQLSTGRPQSTTELVLARGAGAGFGAQLSTGRPQSTTELVLARGAGAGFGAQLSTGRPQSTTEPVLARGRGSPFALKESCAGEQVSTGHVHAKREVSAEFCGREAPRGGRQDARVSTGLSPSEKRARQSNGHVGKTFARPWSAITLKGGSYNECLTALDIDRLLEPVIPSKQRASAMDLYLVRIGDASPHALAQRIWHDLRNGAKRIIAPLHVRYHWTTAVFELRDGELSVDVLDSAPSIVTEVDIRHLLQQLKIGAVTIVCPGRQPWGSLECGVHTVVNAWRAHFGLSRVVVDGILDLSHLRAVFAELSESPERISNAAKRIATNPRDAWVESRPRGGALSPHAVPFVPKAQAPPATRGVNEAPGGKAQPTVAIFVDSAQVDGGAPDVIATRASTSRCNQCYLFAAVQALDVITFGRVQQRTSRQIGEWQRLLGHPPGVQQDVGETLRNLQAVETVWGEVPLRSYAADGAIWALDGSDSPGRIAAPVPGGPFIALDQQGQYFVCPPSHRVIGVVVFTGKLERARPAQAANSHTPALVHAVAGHYEYRDSQFAVRPGEMRVAYLLVPREVPTRVPLSRRAPAAQAVQSVPAVPRSCVEQAEPIVQSDPARAAAARALGVSADEVMKIIERGERVQHARRLARQIAEETRTTTPPPPRAAVGVRPLSRRQVRNVLDRLDVGDHVCAHWGREGGAHGEHEAGVWYGRVTATVPKVLVHFTHSECADCLAPRSLDPEVYIEVPLQGTLYFALSTAQVPNVAACVCARVDPMDERAFEHGTGLPEAQRVLATIEGRCLQAPGATNPRATLTGAAGQLWHIFRGKPEHVHELVWRKLAASTRMQHLRWLHCIRGMHADLLRRPLPAAVVEYVLRMARARRWCWATVSSALSACASALAQLPLYTNAQHPIDLRADTYFSQALQHAQRMARTTAGTASLSNGMTATQLDELTGSRGIKAPNPRLLLLLGWYFGARIGDMRQVRPCDVIVRHREAHADGAVPVVITFRFGKGAAFWGPYSVHAVLPQRVASDLTAALNAGPADQALFTLHDQAALSHAVGALVGGTGRLNLRSVRRGAIQNAAERGLSDDDIMRLSGHKRLDTLYRYLGWGVGSHSAKHAAIRRYQAAVPRGGGISDSPIPLGAQPAKMGRYSGFTGAKGRRVEAPPQFFPKKPPTREQCGVAPGADHDVSTYRLHIKETTRVDWQALRRLARDTPLSHAVEKAEIWCSSDRWYGPPLNSEPRKMPYARFTADQIRELLAADKIRPHTGPVRAFVKAFTVAQHAKQRLRVIAEPAINQTFQRDMLYTMAYPSRLERRARARGAAYNIEFDFAAYFDQFQLAVEVMPWFVLRAREAVDGHRLFALTRMPMGASFAPGVAQAVTSALVFPLVKMDGVLVDTMIDNVRIVATSKVAFVRAVRTFLERVRMANITLNEAAEWEGLTDDDLAHRCAVTDAPRIFLGEKYVRDTVCNSDAAVEKLIAARDRYIRRVDPEDPEAPQYSRRNFASFVGLMLYMAHTVDVPLTGLHTLLRAYGEIISGTNDWDASCVISSDAVDRQVLDLAATLIRNEPVPLPVLRPPELELEAYDVAIEVDASLSAWGAIVRFNRTGRTFALQQRWSAPVSHSAHAEPKAARRALQWARAQPGCANARIAVITDHVAMATGQRRWYASYGGFSTSFFLNGFFEELYDHGGGEIFHIDGVFNRADQLSRDPRAPLTMAVREVDVVFTDLRSLRHPHREIPRLPYQL